MDRDEEGRFSASVSDEELLDAVAANAPAATAAVADAVDLTRQAADHRLRRLREAGRVESVEIGGSLAWSVSGGKQGVVTDTQADDGPGVDDGVTSNVTTVTPDEPGLDARIRALDVPGSGSRLDDRVAATVRVVEYLEAEGEATAEELKALLDDDEVGYADVESYWANWIRGAGVLKAIAEVEAPGKGEKVYRHRTGR
jgi:DNA-binding Lrp family transcriptional regulator